MVRLLVSLSVLLGIGTSHLHAQSLWEHRDPYWVNLFADTAARRVGDLVTIIVSENTDVNNRDQRRLAKSTEAKYEFDFASSGDLGSGAGAFEANQTSNRNFDGQSKYSAEQEFTDRITVPVIDILPNGNLLIGGRRQRLVAGEQRTLIISGTVRNLDISPRNTVRSEHIAQFKICYEGDGPESSFSNQGWAGRLFNKVWPF